MVSDFNFERWVKRSAAASGVPVKVADKRAVLGLAGLLGRTQPTVAPKAEAIDRDEPAV